MPKINIKTKKIILYSKERPNTKLDYFKLTSLFNFLFGVEETFFFWRQLMVTACVFLLPN